MGTWRGNLAGKAQPKSGGNMELKASVGESDEVSGKVLRKGL